MKLAQYFRLDGSNSGRNHADSTCGATGEINRPPSDERPAIVDAHDHTAAVVEVGDADPGAEGEGAVGGCKGGGVEGFTASGRTAGKAWTVP
jgi:hypothetical protein